MAKAKDSRLLRPRAEARGIRSPRADSISIRCAEVLKDSPLLRPQAETRDIRSPGQIRFQYDAAKY